jgi:hypothetical protein
LGKTYIFYLVKLGGLTITQFDSQNFTQSFSVPYVTYGTTGTLNAEFINKDSIFVTLFGHTDDQKTEINTFYLDINQSYNLFKSSIYIPLNTKNIHAVVPQGNSFLVLINDTLRANGEIDFRVATIRDSTQAYNLVWEQSFGFKGPNSNEILVKNCETKTGNQMVLAKRYQPDLQYFILLTDKEGIQINNNKLSLNYAIEDYQILDMQPTLDHGAAILVRTLGELILWKITSTGDLEFEKQIDVSSPPNEFTSIIIRPNGYALFNNNTISNSPIVLYLFNKNLKITGYRKIKTLDSGGNISGGISLENGAIVLAGITFNGSGDFYSAQLRIIVTDVNGFPYHDFTIPSNLTSYYSNFVLKVVENGILLSSFDSYYSYPTLYKINFSGEVLWSTVINGIEADFNSANYLLNIHEIPCKGVVTTVGTKNINYFSANPYFKGLHFQLTNSNGESVSKSCVSLEPTFETCNNIGSFVSDYSFGLWSNKKVLDQSLDLVYERIVYPNIPNNYQPNKINLLNNPTLNGHLCLNISNEYRGDFDLEIWNSEGKLITTLKENKSNELFEKTLEMNALRSGIYYVRAKMGSEVLLAQWSTFFD